MSHFCVLVLGPDPAGQLAPYDEELKVEAYEEDGEIYHRNPKAKWDWWEIGGRWTGWLKLKVGAEGVVGRPGLLTSPADPGTADQTLLQNIDIEWMRDDEGSRAATRYDEMLRLTNGEGIPAFTEIWEDLKKRDDLTWEQRREIYNAQPTIVAFRAMTQKAWNEWERQGKPEKTVIHQMAWMNDPTEFTLTREECIQAARDKALAPFAVVVNGQWFERGKMGWWACVSGEKDQADWNQEVSKLLDGLDPETLVTLVDCHI